MSNRLFLDTNVISDIYLKRTPHYDIVVEFLQYCKSKEYNFCISALTVMNTAYIGKIKRHTIKQFRDLINSFIIIDLVEDLIDWAYHIDMNDFEDAVQYVSAVESECEYFVTWNKKDFKQVSNIINVLTPKEMLALAKNS
jgi:predicted nucleic acid-binding protein